MSYTSTISSQHMKEESTGANVYHIQSSREVKKRDPIVMYIRLFILENQRTNIRLPTNQNHRPVLHILQLAHPGMLLLLPLHRHANQL